jgi:hypothetical protein
VYQTLLDYYRIPSVLAEGITITVDRTSDDVGFFQFGPEIICFGRSQSGVAASLAGACQFDAAGAIRRNGSDVQLPFSFAEVIDNLRLEHYRRKVVPGREVLAASEPIRKFYYSIRELLPVKMRRQLQKIYFRDWENLAFPSWPVDFTVDDLHEAFLRLAMESSGSTRMPFIWFWPDGSPNALMMTHDVETSAGRDFTARLMDLDDSYGIKAAYQVIPEKRYEVRAEYIHEIRDRSFEFNVHDLNHDGHLYRERQEFERRAARINGYIRQYGSRGFRAGAMYRNQDWYDVFEFSYDMSVPNVAHLEPMRGGCCTVMPYFVGKILELERQIILEEKRSRASAQQRVQDQIFERLAPESTLGRRLPIGIEPTIKSVMPDDFREYYTRWYVPSNMTVLVVGDTDPAMVADVIQKEFGGGPTVPKPTPRDVGVKATVGQRAIVVTDPELTRSEVSIARLDLPLGPPLTVAQKRRELVESIGTWAFKRRMSAEIAAGRALGIVAGLLELPSRPTTRQAGDPILLELDGVAGLVQEV